MSSDAASTLLDRLIALYPQAKRQTLKHMVEAGRVTINGSPARKLKQPTTATDIIQVADRAKAPPTTGPSLAPLKLIHEDADLLVVYKPHGLLTSTVPTEKRPTALAIIRAFYANQRQVRIGLIHRLDRDAAGLLVFSKTDLAYQSLKEQFFHHTVTRVYTAVVHGSPPHPQGRIESRLVELPDGRVRSTKNPTSGQVAVTHYEVISRDAARNETTLKVTLHTGRKHQIRVHLSEAGMPIVGDSVYKTNQSQTGERLRLVATLLGLKHPRDQKDMQFIAPSGT